MPDDLRYPAFPRAASYAGTLPTINHSGQAGPAGARSELIILPTAAVSISPVTPVESDRSLGFLVFALAVPEPSSLSFVGLGLGVPAYMVRKRSRPLGPSHGRGARRNCQKAAFAVSPLLRFEHAEEASHWLRDLPRLVACRVGVARPRGPPRAPSARCRTSLPSPYSSSST